MLGAMKERFHELSATIVTCENPGLSFGVFLIISAFMRNPDRNISKASESADALPHDRPARLAATRLSRVG